MSKKPDPAEWALIESLGGPPKVVELLGMKHPSSLQRVHNWKKRGIPLAVKLSRPDLFLRHLMVAPATSQRKTAKAE